MRNLVLMAAVLGVALVGFSNTAHADATVKAVMKKCMKGGLCKKVASGQASAEEKEALLAAFKKMASAKPAKGDAESWKAKTTALVKAAQAAVDGADGAGAALGKAANCKSCHSVHK